MAVAPRWPENGPSPQPRAPVSMKAVPELQGTTTTLVAAPPARGPLPDPAQTEAEPPSAALGPNPEAQGARAALPTLPSEVKGARGPCRPYVLKPHRGQFPLASPRPSGSRPRVLVPPQGMSHRQTPSSLRLREPKSLPSPGTSGRRGTFRDNTVPSLSGGHVTGHMHRHRPRHAVPGGPLLRRLLHSPEQRGPGGN